MIRRVHARDREIYREEREREKRERERKEREREGESGLQPNRGERRRRGFNTPPQAGAWRSNMPSLDPMVSYAGPGRALVKMSAS